MKLTNILILLTLMLLLCPSQVASSAAPDPLPVIERGWATYYGGNFHGRKTASGEIYDKNGISAAHPRWPLYSLVRVTNEVNGKSIELRVNDRGPYKCPGKIVKGQCAEGWVARKSKFIDLSKGAFKKICHHCDRPLRVRMEMTRWGKGE
jgi:rare lipoprotein A (peptidoglycan hydrolase)